MILGTRHTGLVVQNLAKSLVFYRALGLSVERQQLEVGNFISQVVGLPSVQFETAKLGIGGSTLVELLEYKSHPTKPSGHNYAVNSHGCSHVAFSVTDIDKLPTLIEKLGGSIVNPPATSENGLVRVMYCYDIDGILLEMVEELG